MKHDWVVSSVKQTESVMRVPVVSSVVVVPNLFKLMAPTTMADLCNGFSRVDMIDDSINDENFSKYIIFID